MNLPLFVCGILLGILFIRYVKVCNENKMLFYKLSQAEGCISKKVRHHLACWKHFAETYGYRKLPRKPPYACIGDELAKYF